MNEEALKEIWNTDKAAGAQATAAIAARDFNRVEQDIRGWQQKLRRKIKLDVLFNVLAYVLLFPLVLLTRLVFLLPVILYTSPLLLLVWIWYLWENIRIYRDKTNSAEAVSTRAYLAHKKNSIEGYIRRSRLIIYIATPFSLLAGMYASGNFQVVFGSPAALALILLAAEILLLLMVEIWVRKVHAPTLRELKDLLRQLDDEE